jgi:hypothetical protein
MQPEDGAQRRGYNRQISRAGADLNLEKSTEPQRQTNFYFFF